MSMCNAFSTYDVKYEMMMIKAHTHSLTIKRSRERERGRRVIKKKKSQVMFGLMVEQH